MRSPIDASHMSFLAATPSEPVRDFETKQPGTELLFCTQLVTLFGGEAETIPDKVVDYAGPLDQDAPPQVQQPHRAPLDHRRPPRLPGRQDRTALPELAPPRRRPCGTTPTPTPAGSRWSFRRRGVVVMGPDPEIGLRRRGNG